MALKITAHCLVKNEQRWIWFALMSVIDFVDEIIVWDNGSTDATIPVIRSLANPKIKFRSLGATPPGRYSSLRQRMLEHTQSDWLLILDGDEIWPSGAISATRKLILDRGQELDYIVQPFYSLVGDVFHYQPEFAGRYRIGPRRGHLTIRAMNLNRLTGLHYAGVHMHQGIYDASQTLIQNRQPQAWIYQPVKYFHTTHLSRSPNPQAAGQVSRRARKFKIELGLPFPDDFAYPEVFFLPRPALIPDPWIRRSAVFTLAAVVQTPAKIFRRLLYG
jgi:hypothetical protein